MARNVVAPILHFGKTRADAPALIDRGRTIPYGELDRLVRRTAFHLAASGIRPGDRVGLCLKDTAQHIVALLAVAHIGAVAVSLDWRATPGENARFIEGLGIARVLAEPETRLGNTCPLMLLDNNWYRAVEAAACSEESPADWHDPFVITATSGSTGTPKFTQMTHLQFYFAIVGMFELMGLAGKHRFLCTMPLYYSGGRNSCLAHLLRGDCVVLYPNLFSAAEYVGIVEKENITVAGAVPSVVRHLLAEAGEKPLLPSLTTLFSTGAPLYAEEKREAAHKLSPHFHERYGTAETLAISILRPHDLADRADSVGQPHSLAEIQIVDEQDRNLPIGEVGRLRYRGPGMASPLPGQNADANFRNGWYYPGEIARLDQASYIFLQGRSSDVIIRSGAKIYPAEVESALLGHPRVAEAAVLGHRRGESEESVVAFLVLRETVTLGELLAHCRVQLSSHKVPRHFRFLDRLPRNTAGKTDKIALARLLAEETTAQAI
jgi:acyl-coenzyme A synthetase/AMP-(fatty) acid ligase